MTEEIRTGEVDLEYSIGGISVHWIEEGRVFGGEERPPARGEGGSGGHGCLSNTSPSHLFLPSKSAIQKLEPNVSTCSSLTAPGGAMNRLGQLSLYRLPSGVRWR